MRCSNEKPPFGGSSHLTPGRCQVTLSLRIKRVWKNLISPHPPCQLRQSKNTSSLAVLQ